MDVIGDEAVRQDLDVVAAGLLAQQSKIGLLVAGGEENLLTMIATLSNVVWQSGKHESRASWHEEKV